jgi:acyl dehydratase
MTPLHYEDIDVGSVHDLGSYRVSTDELTAFAEQYDPQPIHVDEAAAGESIHGGVIASGWHTASACMRLLVDEFLNDTASMGSFGLDELRWRTPVRAGDTISARSEITDKRESSSRDDRGYVQNELVAHNQHDEEVVFWRATNIFRKRP